MKQGTILRFFVNIEQKEGRGDHNSSKLIGQVLKKSFEVLLRHITIPGTQAHNNNMCLIINIDTSLCHRRFLQAKKKRGQQNTGMQGPPVVELNSWSFCCNARTLRHLATSVFFQIPLVHETVGSPEKGRPELVAGTLSEISVL